ncbi:SWIM zinc finger family protein [Halorubrum yunnanense]|uniref:SWIM zinc finger family protein n=1 Tax=Halorubrum yunnanense TaxID=1526162 RepID=A0ABD5Y7R1_9EURY|nr:SWIM zinc finger family protein [Halorubrum yunnanense]
MSSRSTYDVRVDLSAEGFDPWCDCPYDGSKACKHVVAVLVRCADDVLRDEGDRLDATLDAADTDNLRVFFGETLATDAAIGERFFAPFGESSTRSVTDLRAAIDRQFEETNPDYLVVFEPINFSEWFDLASEYRDQGRYASAAAVYRAPVESLDGNMERVDEAYEHFSQAFKRALHGHVDCVTAGDIDADEAADAVAFLRERPAPGTPLLGECFEHAAAKLEETLTERREH